MVKRELPEAAKPEPAKELPLIPEAPTSKIREFFHKLFGRAFGILKFIFGILLLPLVYATTLSFLDQLAVIDKAMQRYFWSGVITFLLVYLFVLEPVKVYAKGQKILEAIFAFFKPLVRVAPYLLPIYTLILCGIYSLVALFTKDFLEYFIFLFGMSLSLHLVFSARSLRGKQGGFLHGNYIFAFSFIYIINISIAAFSFNLVFVQVSFVGFCNNAFQTAKAIFSTVFKQLFVV
jgi:hypothetical protein